jgi:CHAD domain-containing protein
MPAEHVEVERKFEVPPGFTLPDLTCVPGVAAVAAPEERLLQADYHDSGDLRLARSGVTLRRRTGGPDAGWHVKLPAGVGARRELQFPLGRAGRTVPRGVQAPVRGLLRTAVPVPVARLETRRLASTLCAEDGRVLAEVADDTVTGTVPAAEPGAPASVVTWREIEVELADGDAGVLDAVSAALVDAGARPSRAASKLVRVLSDRIAGLPEPAPAASDGQGPGAEPTAGEVVLAALARQVTALQHADLAVRTGGPDGVHDLRVAARRLRSILAAFRPVLDRRSTDPLRAGLRTLGGRMSQARDGEVALGFLRRLVEEEPPELVLGPVAARLQQAELRDAQSGQKAALRALDDPAYLRLLDDLFELLAAPPLTALAAEPANDVLRQALRRSGKRYRKAVAGSRAGGTGSTLHDVRKAAKRLRYTAEVVEPVLGRRARRVRKRAERVQETLGERQDTLLTRDRCRTLGIAAAAAGENAWSYGRLHALEQGRAERAAEAFWRLEPAVAKAVRRALAGS